MPDLAPHGTIGAARRHERAGEPKCEPCAEAWKAHQNAMYLGRKARRKAAEKQRAATNRKART